MTETTIPQQTTMAAAFERALAASKERNEAPPGIEEQFATMYEENRRLRHELGEAKTVAEALTAELRAVNRALQHSQRIRAQQHDDLTKAMEKVARYNQRRYGFDGPEIRVYGFAFADSDKPLPNHFGRSMRHAKHYAMTDEPDFRDTHDPDLELVECLVRIRPNAKRVRVLDFDRKPHATDDASEAETTT